MKFIPDRGLFVEIEYTRNYRQPPPGNGWLLWDTNPDRKSGWLRVWRRNGRGLVIHADGGCA